MPKNVKFSNKLKVKYFMKNDRPIQINHKNTNESIFDKKPKKKHGKPFKFIIVLLLISFFILYYFWF